MIEEKTPPTRSGPTVSVSASSSAPATPLLPRDEILTGEFWDKNTVRFVAFANFIIRQRMPRGYYKEACDYVADTALAFLEGRRHCTDGFSASKCVLWAIVGMILNDAGKLEHRATHVSITTLPYDAARQAIEEALLENHPGIVRADDEAVARDLIEQFQRIVPDRYRPYLHVRMKDEALTAADRARALGLSRREVLSIDKAVWRLRPKWKGLPLRSKRRRKTP